MDSVQKALAQLEEEERALMMMAVLLPPPLSLDLLVACGGNSPVRVLQALEKLSKAGMLCAHEPSGPGHYRLADPEAAPSILAALPEGALRRTADRLAAHISESDLPEVNRNLIIANILASVEGGADRVETVFRAATHCLGTGAMEAAARYFRIVLDRLDRADRPGRLPESGDGGGIYVDAVLGLLASRGHLTPLFRQRDLLERARGIASASGDGRRLCGIDLQLARVARSEGDYDKAMGLSEEAWQMARRLGDRKLLRDTALFTGEFLFWQGRIADAIRRYEETIGDLEELPAEASTLHASATLGWCYGIGGEVARGMELIAAVRRKAVSASFAQVERYADLMAVLTFLEARRLDEAAPLLEKLLATPEGELGNYVLWAGLAAKAFLLYAEGDLEGAFEYQKRAYGKSKAIGWFHHRGPWNFEYLEVLEEAGMVHPEMNYTAELSRLENWPDLYMQGVGLRFRALRLMKGLEEEGEVDEGKTGRKVGQSRAGLKVGKRQANEEAGEIQAGEEVNKGAANGEGGRRGSGEDVDKEPAGDEVGKRQANKEVGRRLAGKEVGKGQMGDEVGRRLAGKEVGRRLADKEIGKVQADKEIGKELAGGDEAEEILERALGLLEKAGARLEMAQAQILLGRLRIRAGEDGAASELLKRAWSVLSTVNPELFPNALMPYVEREGGEELLIKTLLDIGEAIGTLTHRSRLFERILNLLMRLTRAGRGGFFRLNGEGEPELAAGRNMDRGTAASEGFSRSLLMVERAAATGRELLSPEGAAPQTGAGWRIAFPVKLGTSVLGVVYLDNSLTGIAPPEACRSVLRVAANQMAVALDNVRAYERIEELRDRLEDETRVYRMELAALPSGGDVIGDSEGIRRVMAQTRKVAATDASVLIVGETGAGKEVVARAVHQLGTHRSGPFIPVNSASLDPGVIASELFGHEVGAFTGATRLRRGRFELADGGTLFLDDIDTLSLEIQAKILRALQEKEFERLGGDGSIRSDFRLVAATNRDLEEMVAEGRFRADLYFRLKVFPINIPPLRRRKEDIPLLATHFLKMFNGKLGKQIEGLRERDIRKLTRYDWPGNVRELKHIIERAAILTEGATLQLPDLRPSGRGEPTGGKILAMREMERRHILKALGACGWKISGKGGAAELLGLKGGTLYARMRKLGIEKSISYRSGTRR